MAHLLSFTLLSLLSLARTAVLQNRSSILDSRGPGVIYEQDNVEVTYYYDLSFTDTVDVCAGREVKGWAKTANPGVPKCETVNQSQRSLTTIGSNRIIAINNLMVDANMAYWCGREVKIFDTSGKEITFSEGSFILWDGCYDCERYSRIDLSAPAYLGTNGGLCNNPANNGRNPVGFKFQIMDNYIWKPPGADGATKPPLAGTTVTGIPPQYSIDATSSSVVMPPATTGSGGQAAPATPGIVDNCAYGSYRCNGKDIQICDHLSQSTMGWVLSSACVTGCKMVGAAPVCS